MVLRFIKVCQFLLSDSATQSFNILESSCFQHFHPIFQNKSLWRALCRIQSNIYEADYMEFSILGWISWTAYSNSFRSSRLEVLYKKVCKILQNSKENTFFRVSFWCNFFELLKYIKVRPNLYQFTNL